MSLEQTKYIQFGTDVWIFQREELIKEWCLWNNNVIGTVWFIYW